LKKVSLELGGKNSLIILDDAGLDLAVAYTAWGVYPDMNCFILRPGFKPQSAAALSRSA
jgi:hypothetical protein